MKNIFKERKIHIACVCLLLVMLLAGCDLLKPPIEYGIEYGRNYIKTPHGTAWIGDTYDGVKLVVGNEKNEPLRETGLSEDPWMITASERYLYVVIERRALRQNMKCLTHKLLTEMDTCLAIWRKGCRIQLICWHRKCRII